MSVYVIGRLRTNDFSWLAEYGPTTKTLVEKHGGRYIVQGGSSQRLEGKEELPDAIVVLEFPDAESVHAWHEDPDYQPMIALRQAKSELELIQVVGL